MKYFLASCTQFSFPRPVRFYWIFIHEVMKKYLIYSDEELNNRRWDLHIDGFELLWGSALKTADELAKRLNSFVHVIPSRLWQDEVTKRLSVPTCRIAFITESSTRQNEPMEAHRFLLLHTPLRFSRRRSSTASPSLSCRKTIRLCSYWSCCPLIQSRKNLPFCSWIIVVEINWDQSVFNRMIPIRLLLKIVSRLKNGYCSFVAGFAKINVRKETIIDEVWSSE